MKIVISFFSNLLLLIIALVLGVILLPIGFVVGMIGSFFQRKWYEGFLYMGKNFLGIAIGIDQLGNVTCASLFNVTLIHQSGYKFGNPDETISGVLGKNQRLETLSLVGRSFNKFLNWIDPNHSIKSIEDDESIIRKHF